MSDRPDMILNLIPQTKVALFSEQKVDRKEIQYLIEAARLAPSARNTQIWHFISINDPEMIRRAAELLATPPLGSAPSIIAAQAKPAFFKQIHHEQPFMMIDVPIAMTHISLAASEKRMAVEWRYPSDEKECIELLKLDPLKRLVAIGFVGYPKTTESFQKTDRTRVFHNDLKSLID